MPVSEVLPVTGTTVRIEAFRGAVSWMAEAQLPSVRVTVTTGCVVDCCVGCW
ncbi:MAG: hypothetical protein NVS3B26_20850 [Mycobacteriales bacterium]